MSIYTKKNYLEQTNPLTGLSISQAQGLFDAARANGSALLQRVYAEIESANPVLMTCVQRRAAALVGLGWQVRPRDGFAAGAQLAAARRFISAIDNLDEALEHLDLAFFRGFSHVQPLWLPNGTVRHIALLDSWHFLRDGAAWFWNPDCRLSTDGLAPIPPEARLVSVVRPNAIDYPAMAIHIRAAIAERDWGRYLERYGIPPVDAVMAESATMEDRELYLRACADAANGQDTVWPAGTTISRAEGSRGQDPFSAFIEHQEKLLVLMATGGTLTSLAEAGNGSLAGGAQYDVWREIVRRDGEIIAAALDRALLRPFLERAFPGEEPAVEFVLGEEELGRMGLVGQVGRDQSYSTYPSHPSHLSPQQVGEVMNRVYKKEGRRLMNAGQTFVNPAPTATDLRFMPSEEFQHLPDGGKYTKSGGGDATGDLCIGDTKVGEGELAAVYEAFRDDMGEAAGKVKALIDNLTPENAADFAAAVADLVPADPQVAGALAEAAANAFADATRDLCIGDTKVGEDNYTPLTPEEAEALYRKMIGDE